MVLEKLVDILPGIAGTALGSALLSAVIAAVKKGNVEFRLEDYIPAYGMRKHMIRNRATYPTGQDLICEGFYWIYQALIGNFVSIGFGLSGLCYEDKKEKKVEKKVD
jgi:hypothetical protein